MHFTLDDDLIDSTFDSWRTTYDGPVLLMQDLTTINVSPEQIVVRQTLADQLVWPPPPAGEVDPSVLPPSEAQRPAWLTETGLSLER